MDWANLKKYKKKNEALINKPITKRIVFIGNSIIKGWGLLSPSFLKLTRLKTEELEDKQPLKC